VESERATSSCLRAKGAKFVVAVAHEGGACQTFDHPDALESCDARSEIVAMHTSGAPAI
jgi:hypothetical protein